MSGVKYRLVEPNHVMFTHGTIAAPPAQGGGGGGQPGPNSPGAPAIPDGKWPMGYAGYVKGKLKALTDYPLGGGNGNWNFGVMGYDLSGYRIHGGVTWPAGAQPAGCGGDGFEIIGSSSGTSANAFLDINAKFTGSNFPTFKNFTIIPDVPVKGTNGVMGSQATLFNFEIANVGGDTLSPNNLDTGLPLNFFADWGDLHDCVYYLIGQANGTHNDGLAEVPGGTNATFTRIRSTGIAHPTLGDGVALRTTGPNDGSGPRLLGQINSSFITTQNVSHVGNITVDHCRLGGGWYGTVNLQAVGNTAPLGPIAITNNIFDGNDWGGWDLIIHSNVTGITNSGNTRIDGKALKVLTGVSG